MGEQAANWLEAVDPYFGFLADVGFGERDSDDSSSWTTWVQYRSDTSAVRISKSFEFVRTDVHLIRLVNAQVPPYPIWITDDRIDWMLLDSVVAAREPRLLGEVKTQTGLKPSELDKQLRFWARVLRDVAGDFLAGDFAPLDEASLLVRRRVAEHPQGMRVWLPEDAPKGAEAREASALAATLPPDVSVSVRRYRRGPDRP